MRLTAAVTSRQLGQKEARLADGRAFRRCAPEAQDSDPRQIDADGALSQGCEIRTIDTGSQPRSTASPAGERKPLCQNSITSGGVWPLSQRRLRLIDSAHPSDGEVALFRADPGTGMGFCLF